MKNHTSFQNFVYLFLFIVICVPAYSQQNGDNAFVYLLKQDWSTAKDMKEAAYLMQLIPENDTTYICRYYNKFGSMVRQESYLDSMFAIPNGRFCWYDQNGMLDSTGLVTRSRKTGVWKYYNDYGELNVVIIYDNGHLVQKRDYVNKEFTDGNGSKIPFTISKNAL